LGNPETDALRVSIAEPHLEPVTNQFVVDAESSIRFKALSYRNRVSNRRRQMN
jgi:hypothetical protein